MQPRISKAGWAVIVVLGVMFVLLAYRVSPGLTQSPEGVIIPEPDATPCPTCPLRGPGSAFNYQGQLRISGAPANQSCNFEFRLYSAVEGGVQVGSTVSAANQTLTNGLFSVPVDFGNRAFNGEARWMEVSVTCPNSPTTTLSPRLPIQAVPYALALPGLTTQQTQSSPNILGGYSGNTVANGVVGATISGGGEEGRINTVSGDFGVVNGGRANTAGKYATVNGGWLNQANGLGAGVVGGYNNVAGGEGTTVGGGANNAASGLIATVGGGAGNTATHNYTTIGGGQSNQALATYATIGGGGRTNANDAQTGNRVTDNYGTISGGGNNVAGDGNADPTDSPFATVSGGSGNRARADYATIAGGQNNDASAIYTTIAGGVNNRATSVGATVAGGSDNEATGSNSFAAGTRAKATANGAFVWSDGSFSALSSTRDNEFTTRASGGTRIFSNSGAQTGVRLSAGGTGWQSVGAGLLKENAAKVDGVDVLDKLMAVPIETWSLKSQEPGIRHMGPMAEDFYAAFGLGEAENTLNTVDVDGVALAAIQGLYTVVKEKDGQIKQLETRNETLQTELDDLKARVTLLEKRASASPSATASLPLTDVLGANTWALGGLALALGLLLLRERRR